MGKIHELDAILADQIAAGEVIERPASVVKELVENSLDAHAKRIDVLVEESGLKRIRVIDDGEGIAAAEVALAFRRHATSKIGTKKDLFRVQTMGFRGEALPSIASVAEVTLTTATGGDAGARIKVHGGQMEAPVPASARPGTDVVVGDLFYNTPARLKYLKSPATELSRIVDVVNRLALANPGVALSLTHNGKELFRSAGNGNLQQVFAAIYGVMAGRKMVPISASDPDFSVSGLVSLPELTRASRNYMTLTINHRFVRNFQLTKALVAGYRSKLMVGRYPLAVVNIDLDPLLVDVNVHPAKREVRLSKEEQLADLLTRAVADALGARNLIPDVGKRAIDLVTKDEGEKVLPVREAAASLPRPDQEAAAPAHPAAPTPVIISSRADLATAAVAAFDARYQHELVGQPFGGAGGPTSAANPTSRPASQQGQLALDAARTSQSRGEQGQLALDAVPVPVSGDKPRFPELQYLGQLHGTYLLAQASDGLYIVDQHAAQERINYEHYRKAIGQVKPDQQGFLTPLVLDYSLTDALKIKDHAAVLDAVGLHLAPFGQNSFMLASHPAWFIAGQEEATAREMIDWVLQEGKLTVAQFRAKTAIMMSCKRAIKANHHLDNKQAQALLNRLPECENPFNCPHGRPVTIHFSPTDLEKLFKRIQERHQPFADEFDDHTD